MQTRVGVRFGIAVVAAAVVIGTACGNSGTTKSKNTIPAGGGGGVTEVTGADLTTNHSVNAVGVTSTEIRTAVITATTNILQLHFEAFADGIQDYFDYINSTGGLYGRQLKIVARRDDKMFNNAQTVKASLSQDHAFATFVASPLFSDGIPAIAQANQPTFLWNINPEISGHLNIFGTIAAICDGCPGQGAPFTAQQMHFTKVAVLGYGATASSKGCAVADRASFAKWPTAKVVFFDNSIGFHQADLSSQVSQMKDAGAQIVFTCIDQTEALTLGAEIQKQHANIIQSLPQGYDNEFVSQNAAVLENSIIAPQFVPFEKQPELPELALLKQWNDKSGKQMREGTIDGWIAAETFVHGLKLAGPDFSQQKLIDSLNQDTDWRANGLIEPIDWTKGHYNSSKAPKSDPQKYEGKWNCDTVLQVKGGKFVPVEDQPGKPWVCYGSRFDAQIPAPTYQSFAPAK